MKRCRLLLLLAYCWLVVVTLLPISAALADTETPPYPPPLLPSEAGQNYGLIAGAAFLIIIVGIGILWHGYQHRKARP